ncbi:MAG TPA: hypothetical protein VHA52_04250 [Candidatus Babeliaceae bacterium]|nr:hypothetical protein [Candidatus Babeliaceae bacterium]
MYHLFFASFFLHAVTVHRKMSKMKIPLMWRKHMLSRYRRRLFRHFRQRISFSQQDSSFSASRFSEATTDTAVNRALPLTASLKSFYPYFIYNPDSSYAIDLYSYNILFVKRKGKTVAEQGEPDTEVALIDFNRKTRKRIYFGGTSSAVLDAKWISKYRVLLLTGEVIGRTKFQPELLKYSVGDSTIQDFVYPDTLQLNISDYEDKRLKGL